MARVAIGAMAMMTVLAVPQAAAPAPVEAACGTRWTSRLVPPPTIKVLRTRSGKVQTVSFRRYVVVVMASGEWPSRLRRATLEAGAIATKQYAWFHALKGKHRRGYRNAAGVCYDVRDDVIDQLYRPERAKPTNKQQAAVDKTWPITLRKNGRFFLTGYRAGSERRCAADANGWKLYAKSVEDCASRGWSRRRIQRAYYEPGLRIVRTAHVLGPLLSDPKVTLRDGSRLASRPARVSWGVVGTRKPVARYVLQRRRDGGDWRKVELDDPKARRAIVALRPGRTHQFRVFAVNNEGDRGRWARGPRSRATLKGPKGVTLSGDSAEPSSTNAKVKTRGRSVAYVAPVGPNMGRAAVKVDGRRVATVDLRHPERIDGRLVWAHNWRRRRARTIVVKPLRRDVRVMVDGFLVVR